MVSHQEIEEIAARWVAKRDVAGWSDADEVELASWLEASMAHRVAFWRLEAGWKQAQRLRALGAGANSGVVPPPGAWRASPSFERPSAPNGKSTRGTGRTFSAFRRSFAAAAFLALTLGLALTFWPHGSVYRTQVGGIQSVPLADGSKVTLNTDSEIRVALTDADRRITLNQGEAYFEVAKDPTRPFVVRAADRRVIAVGTKFSVRREGDDVRVVVTEGVVRVERIGPGSAAPASQLVAGAVARSVNANTLVEQKSVGEAEERLSWRQGFLMFHNATLGEAAAEFNRYNERKIVVEDPTVAAIHVGGTFRSNNIDAFVRLIEQGLPLRAQNRGSDIVLEPL